MYKWWYDTVDCEVSMSDGLRNSRGASTAPWGSDHLTLEAPETACLTRMCCKLQVRKLLTRPTHFNSYSNCINFVSHLSKDITKSGYITWEFLFFFCKASPPSCGNWRGMIFPPHVALGYVDTLILWSLWIYILKFSLIQLMCDAGASGRVPLELLCSPPLRSGAMWVGINLPRIGISLSLSLQIMFGARVNSDLHILFKR